MRSRTSAGSFAWRLVSAVTVFLSFTLTVLAIAGALLALPPIVLYLDITSRNRSGSGLGHILVFTACWGTAFALLRGLLSARSGRFEPPGAPLSRSDAPELFGVLDDLAAGCATAAPIDVYLSPVVDLCVLEAGGFLGFGTRRVLIIGAPLIATTTIDELRAGLAHELGHFAGGDTRLTGLLAFTANTFRGMLIAANAPRVGEESHVFLSLGAQVSRLLVGSLVRVFAWLYLVVTRPGARRQELAADVLSVDLVAVA